MVKIWCGLFPVRFKTNNEELIDHAHTHSRYCHCTSFLVATRIEGILEDVLGTSFLLEFAGLDNVS